MQGSLTSNARRQVRGLIDRHYLGPLKAGRQRVLFVVGHMRCGSTLLTNILNTHPEIIGYGETNKAYQSEHDLEHLIRHVYLAFRRVRVTEAYVMDKIVDAALPIASPLLADDRIRFIFLVRAPERTLASTLEIFPDWTETQALEHYLACLDMITNYARTVADEERCYFLTHRELIHETAATLKGLQEFLELDSPLTEQYKNNLYTGRWGYGDISKRIHAGRIVREPKTSPVTLSETVLTRARARLEACCAEMPGLCRGLPVAQAVQS